MSVLVGLWGPQACAQPTPSCLQLPSLQNQMQALDKRYPTPVVQAFVGGKGALGKL